MLSAAASSSNVVANPNPNEAEVDDAGKKRKRLCQKSVDAGITWEPPSRGRAGIQFRGPAGQTGAGRFNSVNS